MNITRKNFLRWSAISAGGVVFGTALPACGGGGGGGGSATAGTAELATPTAVQTTRTAPTVAPEVAPAPPAFNVSLAASRVSGVAPLYVNFDATGTTHPKIANPTHDLFYSWMYGDTTAGTWANGVKSAGLTSKNAAFGPVSGHVFETPGTFVVNLIAMDGVNTETKSVTITVQDPNLVYAGANTICISSSGNFVGAPSGAMHIHTAGNTNMFAAFSAYKASNKRILFCKADSWVSSATIALAGLTGTFLGGYGTGPAHTFASGTLASITPAAGIGSAFEGGGSTDCRICNFKIAANATHYGVSASTADSVALTLYKIEVRGATAGFSSTTGGSGASLSWQDQHCIYECLVDQLYGYAGFNPPAVTGASVAATGIFTAIGHKFNRYNKVQLFGTAPAGLSIGVNYYISGTNLTANTFSLSTSFATDAPITTSGTGTCDVRAIGLSGGIGAFVAFKRGGFMGNYIDSCNNGEQTLRMPYLNTAHVNNNYIARPNQTKNVVKIHCRGYDEISPYSSGYSEKIVVTANVMDLRGGYSYSDVIPNNGKIATFVGSSDIVIGNGGVSPGGERVRNAIIEHNFTYTCLGNAKDSVTFASIGCPNVTVRNNIADFSKGDRTTAYTAPYPYTGMYFASVGSSTTQERTAGVRIYNNTSYSNLANSETADFVYLSKASPSYMDVDDIKVNNNIWYYPHAITSSKAAVRLSATAASTNVVATNNTNSVAGGGAKNTPNFVATPPIALSDWKPKAGSYAIGSGAAVPVLRDFNQAQRVSGVHNLGAVLP